MFIKREIEIHIFCFIGVKNTIFLLKDLYTEVVVHKVCKYHFSLYVRLKLKIIGL
jgi:hypothetical protein